MTVNLLLLPVAYVKTCMHKALLLKKYGGSWHRRNFFSFLLLGLFILLATQFVDVYHFLRHTFSSRQQQQHDKLFEQTIALKDFN